MSVAPSSFWREVWKTAEGSIGRRRTSTLRAMPCVVNGKVVLFRRLTCPRLSTRCATLFSNLKGKPVKRAESAGFSCQNRLISAHSYRWRRISAEDSSPWSSLRGLESGRRDWKSSDSSRIRTFARSPRGSENSSNSEGLNKEDEATVEKILGKGLLARAAEALEEELSKPEICTADELHYVAVPGTTWRLALWRYLPKPNTPKRNHPLLMLSGIGTNALGFDLDPNVSMARSMAGAGFDTWILEVRGAGLSKSEKELGEDQKLAEKSDGSLIENVGDPDNGRRGPASERAGHRDTAMVDSRPLDKVSSDPPEGGETPAQIGVANEKSYEIALSSMDKQSSMAKKSGGLTDEDGAVTEKGLHGKRSRAPVSEEGTSIDTGSQSKRSSHSKNVTSVADDETRKSQEFGVIRPKEVAGVATWETAAQLSEMIVTLTDKLSKLLTNGQSKILSARFVDSVVSAFEDSALSKGIAGLRERLVHLMETQEKRTIVFNQLSDLRKKLVHLLEDGQDAVSPQVTNLQERFNRTMDDFQKVVALIEKYDWDFDDYLEEDVPTAMEYIRNRCKPVDGKLLSVGHSMGGIVLYALLSSRGNESGLAGAVALASALDYQCSNTSLKLLLPLVDPAQVFNVPLVPLGGLMSAVHPLVTMPPYALAWLGHQVSAQNMMESELFSKLVLNNFGTIPVKLLLHLISVFQPGGLSNRDGTLSYKENIGKVTVPVLAIAGDQDLICPPTAVMDTVNMFPKETVTYKCFGGEIDRHYGHYDIVCSLAAKEEIFPVIADFLVQNDEIKVGDKFAYDV